VYSVSEQEKFSCSLHGTLEDAKTELTAMTRNLAIPDNRRVLEQEDGLSIEVFERRETGKGRLLTCVKKYWIEAFNGEGENGGVE
jgi:hypothetical protein